MTSPEGVIYSATDADREGDEGRFYLWRPAEIKDALDPADADLAIRLSGVTAAGNFEGRNILHWPAAPESFAATQGPSMAQLWRRVDAINQSLYQTRKTRCLFH